MTTAEEKVERFTETFLDAYNAGDAAGAASFYAENAVYMPMHHPAVAGRPELTPEETIESGGLIVQRGGYIVLLEQGDGGVVEDAGKYVIVCEESSEGALQILWDIDNSDFPAA
jgi:hypothetical protein